MTPELTKPQYAQEQLNELNQTLEKEKVQLTPEVEEYVRSHVRAVQDKLQAGEDVYESDLAFIEKVKMWVMMPKFLRENYKSVEEMEKSEEFEEIREVNKEANKRHISPKQWLDLLHVAGNTHKWEEGIDETFTFPGRGKIETEEDLYLTGCTGLIGLPEGLSVRGELNLNGCTGLTGLPEGLRVGTLDLRRCTGLTGLPAGLKVGRNLYLTKNLNEQVKKDAEKLKAEGKIGGVIIYEK